jgi:hypothetical protein
MRKSDAYLFYEAGQAVAAVHLGLTVRHVSGNPLAAATEIVLPRGQPKARMILWLTGMAAEKRGAGAADPLRRTRTRHRIRSTIESIAAGLDGPPQERLRAAKHLLNQAQDRANAICSNLYDAIEEVAAKLREADLIEGSVVVEIVRAAKTRRTARGRGPVEEEPPEHPDCDQREDSAGGGGPQEGPDNVPGGG